MPKTWDASRKAFVESETPRTRGADGVWRDSEGYTYNTTQKAWQQEWPGKLWLYKDGDECVSVTGGWQANDVISTAEGNWYDSHVAAVGGAIGREKCSDLLALYANAGTGSVARASFYTLKKIDLSGYKKICAEAHMNFEAPGSWTDIGYTPDYMSVALVTASPRGCTNSIFTAAGGHVCRAQFLHGTVVSGQTYVKEAAIPEGSGPAYVFANCYAYIPDDIQMTNPHIYKIWLER